MIQLLSIKLLMSSLHLVYKKRFFGLSSSTTVIEFKEQVTLTIIITVYSLKHFCQLSVWHKHTSSHTLVFKTNARWINTRSCLFCAAVERNVLNDYIHHYEALTYDVHGVQHSHRRVRRSLDSSVRLGFHAHGRLVFSSVLPAVDSCRFFIQ